MYFKSFALVCLIFVVAVQADYKGSMTKAAKDCIVEMKIEDSTLRTFISEHGEIKEDDITEKFFECCMRTHISDTNEVIADDKFINYMTDVFTNRLEGRRNLAKILVTKCVDHCKDTKDVTKGKTAVKTINCCMTTLNDILKKE